MAAASKETTRQDELAKRKPIRDKLLKLYATLEKGFLDQRDRADNALDYWDAYNCKLGDKQFYSGNTRIYLPFIHDAVDARKTRFTNQLFPQSGRYVEVLTEDETLPNATAALLEYYVRKNQLRNRIVRPLVVSGDMEGQYSLYVSWCERERFAGAKVQKDVETQGMEFDDFGKVEDFVETKINESMPWCDIIPDGDLLVWPVASDTVDQALDSGGGVAILRRWSREDVKRMIASGDFIKDDAENLVTEMDAVSTDTRRTDTTKANADAAGIKKVHGKHVVGYEVWTRIKIGEDMRIVRAYFGGEKVLLGCKLNPYWNDKVPVLSIAADKVANVFKGRPPITDVIDLQIFANDTINEGADTAHFSAMPIILTDPEKNPRINSMVLGLAAVWETSPKDTQFAEFPELWKDALERAEVIKQQIFQTLSVNPSMIPNQKGAKSKPSQADVANEQQVDLMTTADAVTVLDEGVLSPLLQWFADLDAQFRDEKLLIPTYGEMGEKLKLEEIEPQQVGHRFEFRWFGVEAVRNAAQMQQQIAGINVLKGIPPEQYSGYKLNLAPVMTQMVENLFGPRLAPKVFEKIEGVTVDPMVENDMMEHGFKVEVHPADDDQQHLQVHMQLMQTSGDPHQTIREHIAKHQQQLVSKAQAQQGPPGGQPPQGGPGKPAQHAPTQGGQPPKEGAQPGDPSNMRQPPGAIHPDAMGRAGAPMMPRK